MYKRQEIVSVIDNKLVFGCTLQRSADQDELFLAKYSEIEKREAPCFFWGKLTQPYMTARCLIALSDVYKRQISDFYGDSSERT